MEGIPNTISSDPVLLVSQSEIYASATKANNSEQFEYPKASSGEFYVTDLPIRTINAQHGTATDITGMIRKAEQDTINDHAKCAKKTPEDDREYEVEPIVRHVGRGSNKLYVIRFYSYIAADDSKELSPNMATHLIKIYWRKMAQAKRI